MTKQILASRNDHATDSPFPVRPSVAADTLRPVLLLAGTQVMRALLGSVLTTISA